MQECLDENYCIDFKERVAVDMGDSSDERNNIPEDRAKIRARWEVCKRQCRFHRREQSPLTAICKANCAYPPKTM